MTFKIKGREIADILWAFARAAIRNHVASNHLGSGNSKRGSENGGMGPGSRRLVLT